MNTLCRKSPIKTLQKLIKQIVVAIGLAICSLPSIAGAVLDSYWPLNDGDQKQFAYSGNRLLTLTVSDQGYGLFRILEHFGKTSENLYVQQDENSLSLVEVSIGWIKVHVDPLVSLLDDDTLLNGGILRTDTTVSQPGISYPARFTIRVAKARSVTVPAGTFTDCRKIIASERAVVPGYGVIQKTALTAYLAPGVGIIKTAITPGRWANLVNGTVGGSAVGDERYSGMTVTIYGGGKLSPNYNDRLLQIGMPYTMRASPKRGYEFYNWTDESGNVLGTDPVLTFQMQPNMAVTANFEIKSAP